MMKLLDTYLIKNAQHVSLLDKDTLHITLGSSGTQVVYHRALCGFTIHLHIEIDGITYHRAALSPVQEVGEARTFWNEAEARVYADKDRAEQTSRTLMIERLKTLDLHM